MGIISKFAGNDDDENENNRNQKNDINNVDTIENQNSKKLYKKENNYSSFPLSFPTSCTFTPDNVLHVTDAETLQVHSIHIQPIFNSDQDVYQVCQLRDFWNN